MINTTLTLRMAVPEDADALLAIYTPYVEKTAISFEYQIPSREEFSQRISSTLSRYPYIVACRKGTPVGYAYVSPFHGRAAYGWSVETSIYVREDIRGCGCGRLLYEVLEEILKRQHIINSNACISFPNPPSIAFHQSMGYKQAAHFNQCGYKLGRWWDVVWMEKMLGEHNEEPLPFIPVGELSLPENLYLLLHPQC